MITTVVSSRQLFVGGERLERWVTGFGERHGAVAEHVSPGRVELRAADGAVALLQALFGEPTGTAALAAGALESRRVAVLLVRRGGYACAVLDGDTIVASKVGSRHVQGRTAAGGWSQQRFARRREGQAAALVGSTSDVAARVLLAHDTGWLVTGGDRPLVDEVLADPRLKPLRGLPRGPHLEVGDPKKGVLAGIPERLRSIRITLSEP